ncbi:Hippocampus abundant transcript 1 protein [Xylographa soralifera]|nr:Hippocampus abundant transcript 1 protein [Xylographa soralifera]
MAPNYAYQKVNNAESEGESQDVEAPPRPSTKSGEFSLGQSVQVGWLKRPSVFWLLPVFLLFNLAMGMTAMPRMNVLISLTCRNVLSNGMPAGHEVAAGGSMGDSMGQNSRRHMGMGEGTGHTGNGTGPLNYSPEAVVIGEYNPQCSFKEVESSTAMLTLYGNLIAGILGAIFTPVWGKLSDRYGRVRPLAAAASIFLGGEVISVLIAALPNAFPLNWIYFAFILEGFSGSFLVIMALASSYAVDCTQDNERNVAIGYFHGSMFLGMAAGPIFGGYLGMSGGESRPMLIFYTALVMRVFGIAFLLFLVPESLPCPETRSESAISELKQLFGAAKSQSWPERIRSANPLHLLRILAPSKATAGSNVQRNLITLTGINTIIFGSVMGAMNVLMLYSEFEFGWGNKESGIFLSAVNFSRTIATIGILPLAIYLYRRWLSRTSQASTEHGFDRLDLFLIRTSVLSDVIGFLGYAFAPTGALFILSGIIASLGAIGLATSEASMTKLVDSSQIGELLGALGFLQAVARIIAPTIASLTYSWTVASMPQLVFMGIAVCFVAAFVVSFFARPDTSNGTFAREEGEDGEPMIPLPARKACARC